MEIFTRKTIPVPRKDWIIAENAHEPIISTELFYKAQAVVRPYKESRKKRLPTNIFNEFLKCQSCGRTLTFKNTKEPYYRCETRRFIPDCECGAIKIHKSELEDFLVSSIQMQIQLLLCKDVKSRLSVPYSDTIEEQITWLEKEIRQCETKQVILFEKLADAKFIREEYIRQNRLTDEKKQHTKKEIQSLVEQLKEYSQKQDIGQYKDLGKYFGIKILSKKLFTDLIRSIWVYPDNTM